MITISYFQKYQKVQYWVPTVLARILKMPTSKTATQKIVPDHIKL